MALNDFKPYDINGLSMPMKCLYARMINGFYVPCGKCEFCRRSKSREWAFRLEQESFDTYVYNCLLTYRDEDLIYHKGQPTVCKIHIQEFLKRLRYHIDKTFHTRIRYFLCAEYGGHNHRPHYHMILFSDKPLTIRGRDPYSAINEILVFSWRHGIADIEPLTDVGGSVNYLTSYMVNYFDGIEYDEYNKPFLMMSRCGLGKRWIDNHKRQVKHMIETQDYITVSNGYKLPLPRYLRRKIMPEEQQIARADSYLYYSNDYETQKNKLNYYERNEHFKRLYKERERQKQRERESYRKAKIHSNNSNTSQLSRRVDATKVKQTIKRTP